MKKHTNFLTIFLLVAAILLIPFSVSAQAGPPHQPHPAQPNIGAQALGQHAQDKGVPMVRFTGVVSEIASDHWVVANRTVAITDETVITGEPAVGVLADVMAQQTEKGLVAIRINVLPTQRTAHFPGLIKEMHENEWIITTPAGDQTVAITSDTVIEGDTPDVGDRVKVWATESENRLTATRIVVIDTPAEVHFRGRIQEVADDYWVVAHQKVAITAETVIEGEPDVGDAAEVWAKPTAEGLVATRLVVIDMPTEVHFRGRIQEVADDYLVVAHQKVAITPDTVIEGEPNVGDVAEVWATPASEGLVASRIVITDIPHLTVVIGEIGSMTDGIWVVDGKEITVNEQTRLIGQPEVGDQVAVVAQIEDDDSLTALLVTEIFVRPKGWPRAFIPRFRR